MTTRRRKSRRSPEQESALRTLRELVAAETTPLVRVDVRGWEAADLLVAIRLKTEGIEVAPGGLPISPDHEDVVLAISPLFPWVIPSVAVEHSRFVGHAHVLQGFRLCVFLDPSQEWHPSAGIGGFLDGLWRWFEDAAAGRFDATRALYHPVGGVLHRTPGTPTIVVREPLGLDADRLAVRWVLPRTANRLDLVSSPGEGHVEVLLAGLPGPLSYGAGTTMADLCRSIARLGFPTVDAFLGALAVRAARNPPGSPLYFVLAVPGPRRRSPEDVHLIAGRLPAAVAERLSSAMEEQGALPSISTADAPADTRIEWCRVSEEREAVTTRRDVHRPTAALRDATVALWGCGGLGSWMAEFLARAGVAGITLSDTGDITGGLLVRQNFEESDIGMGKADALAERLRRIRDDLLVDADPSAMARALRTGALPAADVLVDATVSNSVSAAVGSVWGTTSETPLVATVATDRATATLGYLSVTRPPDGPTPEELDRRLADVVLADPEREPFHSFWGSPGASDEVLPAPGCSVPTFHGSAADLAGVAASLVSLLGPHLHAGLVGCHLVSLPHGIASSRCHDWVDAA